jgi:hypothetical protein
VTAKNSVGSIAAPPFVVAPTAVTFTDCGQTAGVTLAGGTGNYIASQGGPPLTVVIAGPGLGSITLPSDAFAGAPPSAPVDLQAGFSDGQTAQSVTVHITGFASCT